MDFNLRRLGRRVGALCCGVGAAAVLTLLLFGRVDAAVAVAAGIGCGIANMLALMYGSERLLDSGNRLAFGLSSLLRLAGFSIVAAALALRGPWWSLGPFILGFFFPLATYAASALRIFRTRA
ncbi:MAG: hypothetical protein JO030_01265 [Candidatus Eremiobacteraeota bacterium]|nr:hypothetical protein [Candidatus Eremiobacteraeota bacterium]